MTWEHDVERPRAEPTDEGNIPGRPSPARALIVVVALVVGLLYFGVTRTATPPEVQSRAPTVSTPHTE